MAIRSHVYRRGSFGNVYAATHRSSGGEYAVKVMDRSKIKATSIHREWNVLEHIGQHEGEHRTVSMLLVQEAVASAVLPMPRSAIEIRGHHHATTIYHTRAGVVGYFGTYKTSKEVSFVMELMSGW